MPFCIKCGHKLPDEASFCPNCGAQVTPKVAVMKLGTVKDAITRLSNASDEQKVVIAMELLKDPNYEVRGAVASEIARLNIRAIGPWFELANRLAPNGIPFSEKIS